MTEESGKKIPKNSPCPGCGGSGQSSFFGGESRFMFTWEDCPDCCGTGIVLDDNSFGHNSERDETPS